MYRWRGKAEKSDNQFDDDNNSQGSQSLDRERDDSENALADANEAANSDSSGLSETTHLAPAGQT